MHPWAQLDRPLILASDSPRRREILARLGFEFATRAPEVDNEAKFFTDTDFDLSVRTLAEAKAR